MDRPRRPKVWRLQLTRLGQPWRLAALLLFFGSAAVAEMRVEPGDKLHVEVLEAPEFGRDAPVGIDGTIMLPGLGAVEVQGKDLATVRSRIESALRDRGLLRTPTVLVDFASYRPLYVGGTVLQPGAVAFEPGLTVRHALILAGGVGAPGTLAEGGLAAGPTSAELADIKGRLRSSSFELFQADSLIARLTAELERRAPETGLAAADSSEIARMEDAKDLVATDDAILQDRLADWQEGQSHREASLGLVRSEIDILAQQADLQRGEQEVQQQDIENARNLVDRGLMPRSQLTELQREASQLSRDLLDNQAFAARAQQEQADRQHELSNADTQWRIGIREQIRTAVIDRARLRAEVENLRDQLRELGIEMDSAGGIVTPEPVVVIYRSGPSGTEPMSAQMETALQPGDIVEVSLAQKAEGS